MNTHPDHTAYPSPDEVRAIVHQANQERARFVRASAGRMIRALASLAAPRRRAEEEEFHYPTVSFGARR